MRALRSVVSSRVPVRWVLANAMLPALLLGCDSYEPQGSDPFWGSGMFRTVSSYPSTGGRFDAGSRVISADLKDGIVATWTTDSVFWHDTRGASGVQLSSRAVPDPLSTSHLGRISVISPTEALWIPSGDDQSWVLPKEAAPYLAVSPGCVDELLDGAVSPDGNMIALFGLSEGGQLTVRVSALGTHHDDQTCVPVSGFQSFRWLPAAFVRWDGDHDILLATAFPRVAMRYRVAADKAGAIGIQETWRFQAPEWERDGDLAFRGDPAVVREWALRSGMLSCAIAAKGTTYLCHVLPNGTTEIWCVSAKSTHATRKGRLSPNPANLLSESKSAFLIIRREIDYDVIGVFTPQEGEDACEP